MAILTSEHRDEIERLLLRERRRAVESIRRFDETRGDLMENRAGETSVYRFHLADVGTEMEEQEKQMMLASREGTHISDIDDALLRLRDDPERFGACVKCGNTIGFERLLVVPTARLCLADQTAAEERGGMADAANPAEASGEGPNRPSDLDSTVG